MTPRAISSHAIHDFNTPTLGPPNASVSLHVPAPARIPRRELD